MSMIRAVKSGGYSVINNTILNDDRLTWEAKGMACYLLSKPDDWRINTNHLWRSAANGHSAVKRILRELQEARYLRRERVRNQDGTFDWEIELYEVPQEQEPAPSDENHPMETIEWKPSNGNHATETIEWFSSDILNTEYQLLTPITEEKEQRAALPPELPVTTALDGEPLPVEPEAPTTTKTLAKHPAVTIYRDTFLAFPSRAQMHQIVQAGVTDLEQWQQVTQTWLGRGYNPRNIGGMLEWYGDPTRMAIGSPSTSSGNRQNGHRAAPQPATNWDDYARPVPNPERDALIDAMEITF